MELAKLPEREICQYPSKLTMSRASKLRDSTSRNLTYNNNVIPGHWDTVIRNIQCKSTENIKLGGD